MRKSALSKSATLTPEHWTKSSRICGKTNVTTSWRSLGYSWILSREKIFTYLALQTTRNALPKLERQINAAKAVFVAGLAVKFIGALGDGKVEPDRV